MQLFSWETVRTEVMNAKIWRKVISGERAMVAQVFIAKGAVVPAHQHESEQLTYILEGALEFELEGRRGGGPERRGAAHSVKRAAPGGSARGHARSRHLQPHPHGLAHRAGRLSAQGELMDLGLEGSRGARGRIEPGIGEGSRHGAGARGRDAGHVRTDGQQALEAAAETSAAYRRRSAGPGART